MESANRQNFLLCERGDAPEEAACINATECSMLNSSHLLKLSICSGEN
jgi:hypothetical protein